MAWAERHPDEVGRGFPAVDSGAEGVVSDWRAEKNNGSRYFLLDLNNGSRYFDFTAQVRLSPQRERSEIGSRVVARKSLVIANFKDAEARRLYETGKCCRIPQDIQRTALRKLKYMNNAADLNDLRVPPGNHLEALSGDREGQHSIRINDQYRICFTWNGAEFRDVEIVDCH
jgi:toxin HigB-1